MCLGSCVGVFALQKYWPYDEYWLKSHQTFFHPITLFDLLLA